MSITVAALPQPALALVAVSAHPHWPTPRRLTTLLAVLWLAAALLLLVALTGAGQRRQALQTIGYEAAPSIVNAQQIKADLSDMDASAAQVLLLPPGIAQEAADDHYERRRIEATDALAQAARNLTGGAKERQPLETLAGALGTYETDVAQARLLHLRGEPGSRLVYRMTHSEMHDTLLPAADALRSAGDQSLQAAYRRQQGASKITLALLWITGLLLLGLLMAVQIFLFWLTHRMFSLPLLGATVITLVFLLSTSSLWMREQATLGAVNDAFASVSGLWETRATAFDMNSEESRWLMDTPQAPQYEQLYTAQAGHLTDITSKLPSTQEIGAAYTVYSGTDRRLRALENGGSHSGAVTFCVGTLPGQHQEAFDRLSAALDRALATEQKSFSDAAADGARRQAGYDVLAVLAILAVAALVVFGLRPRLQEYAP